MFKARVYVCHTYYHVYVTLLKEFALQEADKGKATLVLSKMSTDFEKLQDRLQRLDIFEQIITYDEKPFTYFKELDKYRTKQGNFLKKTVNRIIFTKKFAKLQEKYVPINFAEYKDIYVYCDSDPIGYYLNYKHIYYHSVEDGLNSLAHLDAARYDNRGNFAVKAFLAKHNLIFIQNGYSKYCIDVEVNRIEGIRYPMAKHKEVPRGELQQRLTEEEKQLIIQAFVAEPDKLMGQLSQVQSGQKHILLLTEPLCDLETRKQIFEDLIQEYSKQGVIVIKPHPRDELVYEDIFADYMILDKRVPMEVFNLLGPNAFDLVVSVLTDISEISFAKNTARLGQDFMDKYEAPEIHRQNEQF